MDTPKKIQFLEKAIRKNKDLYYKGVPEVSDSTFDAMLSELKKIDPTNPVIDEVGAPPSGGFRTAKHKMPMGSLGNVFDSKEAEKYLTNKMLAGLYVIQWKLDGFSVSAEYVNGKLINGITRGDGVEGTLITHALSKMQNVKTELPDGFTGSLRGEGVIMKPDFEKLSEQMEAKGLKRFANTRNAAAGISKRHDATDAEFITVVWFDAEMGSAFGDEHHKMQFIKGLGITPVESYLCTDIYEALDKHTEMLKAYPNMPFDADGTVIKVNDLDRQKELGYHHLDPKWAIAYKFPQEQKKVELLDIIWSYGSTGRFTPVAKIAATELSGVMVENLSLHNPDLVKRKSLSVGALVMASRHGGVIPQVDELVVPGTGETNIPTQCPFCKSKPQIDGKYLICPNDACEGKAGNVAKHWVDMMGWKFFGTSNLNKLVESELVKTPSDFWELTVKNMVGVGVSPGMAKKLLREIEESKPITIPQLFDGMAFRNIGASRIEKMMDGGLDTIDKLLDATKEQVAACDNMGEIMADNYMEGLELRSDWIIKVLEHVEIEEATIQSNALEGKAFQFTGTMKKLRVELETLAVENGARIGWKKGFENILVMNPGTPIRGKAKKAADKGYPVITEMDFMALL